MSEQIYPFILLFVGCVILLGLFPACMATSDSGGPANFDQTLAVLQAQGEVTVLGDREGESRVAVVPEFNGRVMMSGWDDADSPRLGWVNEPVVTGKERNPAFVNYGGAERLWLSPEGGQFALFFKPGDPFDLDHWWTPTTFNSDPYEILDQSNRHIAMARDMRLSNYQGTSFHFRVLRTVAILERSDLNAENDFEVPSSVRFVGFTTRNVLTNRGYSPLSMKKGLVSLWILSQFDANRDSWVIFPYKTDAKGGRGPSINDDYFGKVPPERLKTLSELECSLFKCDSRRRTKIGLSQGRARNRIGSIDFGRNILTVMTFNLPREGAYANNSWKIQEEPFAGDVVNSYNNGIEGKDADVAECFYELETLSPVRELSPGHRLEHINTTMHFCGPLEDLDTISQKLLGVDLVKVRTALFTVPVTGEERIITLEHVEKAEESGSKKIRKGRRPK